MAVVSVVVSIYNTIQWLTDCVESIRNQTLQDIEIILVDDGSIDYSGVICDAYAEIDDRIKVLHQENRGVSAARNAGMDLATGKYIMFCDSDDYVSPEWCAKMLLLAEKFPEAWVCSGFAIVDGSGTREFLYEKAHDYSVVREGNYLQLYKSGLMDAVWNKIYRRSIIVKHGIRFQETVRFGEDTLFVTDYWKRTQCGIVRNINPLYYYRRWSANTLSSHVGGIGRFYDLTKKLAAVNEFLTEDEKVEFLKNTFWRSSRYCLWHILSPDHHESIEIKTRDCRRVIESPEFQEWYKAVSDDGNDPWIEALRKMDYPRIYELLSEYYAVPDYAVKRVKYEN